jgi:hypothetical protein
MEIKRVDLSLLSGEYAVDNDQDGYVTGACGGNYIKYKCFILVGVPISVCTSCYNYPRLFQASLMPKGSIWSP